MKKSSPAGHARILPQRVTKAIRAFQKAHPQYSTPSGAKEKCREASGLFCGLLADAGIAAVVDELDVIDGMAHKAVRVASVWVDWTARQHDPAAPWPKLIRPDDLRQHHRLIRAFSKHH